MVFFSFETEKMTKGGCVLSSNKLKHKIWPWG
jgi:hypothetical protein